MSATRFQSMASRPPTSRTRPPVHCPVPIPHRKIHTSAMALMEEGMYGPQTPPLSSASIHKVSIHTHRRAGSGSSRRSSSRSESRPTSPSALSENSIHLSWDTLPPRVASEGLMSWRWNSFAPGEMSCRSPSRTGSTLANHEDSVVHFRGSHREGSTVRSLLSAKYNLDHTLAETLRHTLASRKEFFENLRTPSPVQEDVDMEDGEVGSGLISSSETRAPPLSGWYPTFTSDDAGKSPITRPPSSVAGVGLSSSVYGGRRSSWSATAILLRSNQDDSHYDHPPAAWRAWFHSDDVGNQPFSRPPSSVAGVASMSSSFTSSRRGSLGVTTAFCGCTSIDEVLQGSANDEIRASSIAQRIYEAVNDPIQGSSGQVQHVSMAMELHVSTVLSQADSHLEEQAQHANFTCSISTDGDTLGRYSSLCPPLVPHVDQIRGPPVSLSGSVPVSAPVLLLAPVIPSSDTEDEYDFLGERNPHDSIDDYYENNRALREGYLA